MLSANAFATGLNGINPYLHGVIERCYNKMKILCVRNDLELPSSATNIHRAETVNNLTVVDGASGSNVKKIYLGRLINRGRFGLIYEDARDDKYIYKKEKKVTGELLEEVTLFNAYYGAGSSELIKEDGETYVRMLKLPGETLRNSDIEEIRSNSDKFNDMIIKLHDIDVIHGDFTFDNILFDKKHSMFYPVDITNINYKNPDQGDYGVFIANIMIEFFTRNTDTQISFQRKHESERFNVKMYFSTRL